MTYQEIIEKIKPEFQNELDVFAAELMKIRSGRLSPNLVEDIKVECFGSVLPLKQLGAISIVSPKELLVQLWDKSYVEGVVKAIEEKGFGFGVRTDGTNLYLSTSALTEETRQNLIQLLNKKKEETFQNLRRVRDKVWKMLQDGFQKGEVREDDKYKGKDKLDELTRDYREKMEKMAENKEKEIKG